MLLPVAEPWRYWMVTLGAGALGPLWVPLGASIVYAPWSPFRANVRHFLDPVLPHFYTQGFSILSKALKSTKPPAQEYTEELGHGPHIMLRNLDMAR